MLKAVPSANFHNLCGAANASNIKIRGLTIDGNLGNSVVLGMGFFNCHDVLLEDCQFQYIKSLALQFSNNIINVTLNRCRFYHTGNPDATRVGGDNDTISVNFQEATLGNSRNIFVTDNTFDYVGLSCLQFVKCDDVLVRGNYSRRSTAGFIGVTTGDGIGISGRRFRIVDNHSEAMGLGLDPYSNGIDLLQLHDSVVANNVCCGNGAAGIGLFVCQNIVCVGNVCNNNHQDEPASFVSGIVVRNNDSTGKNITIDNNVCTDTQVSKTQSYGLAYEPTPGLKIGPGNIFTGNAIADIAIIDGDIAVTSTRTHERIFTNLAMSAGWVNVGAGAQLAGFSRTWDNWVDLYGYIKNGTITNGTSIGNLPADCRPTLDILIIVQAGDGTAALNIRTNGNIELINADANAADGLSLSNVRFSANILLAP